MKKLFTLFAAMLIATMGFAAEATATISFANKAQRTVYTTSQQVWEQNGIVVTNDKASSTNNVGDYANPARFYKSSKVTIQCTLGNIKKIEISGWGDSKYNVWVASVGSEAAASGSSVVITPTAVSDTYVVNMTGGQGRAGQMVVTYEVSDAGFVSTPTIEGEQYFKESTTVSMKAAEGLTIYYTVDGTEPTTASTAYTAPFALDKTTTVKAVASDGTNLSEVVTVEFKKMQVLTCAEAAAITPAGDKYIVRGYVTTANAYSTQYNNIDFFMADTKEGGNVLKIYRAVAASETDKDVKVGDYVEVVGELVAYQGTIQIAQGGTYTIIPAPAPAATVVTVENTTVSEMAQNLVLQGQWNEKSVAISLYPGATKGFGVYSGEGEGDFWGSIGTTDLFANGTDATYTDNGNGTFTFKATMKDATNALYDITMNGAIPVKKTYTVAGSPVAVFGTEWDPTNTENDMTLMSGTIYSWMKEGLTLSAGKIQFKVCEDHAWTTAYPASNYELDIPGSGIYTIMIMFDAASGVVEAFAEKTGDAVVIPTIAIAGDMNGWNTTANTFTMAADEKTASLVLNLEAKDYGFKMIIAGSWTNDGQKITRENNSAVYTGANVDANGTLTADVAGEYTFTWTYETNTLVVTYPAKEEPKPATWDEIVFTEVAAKGSLNGAVFKAPTNAAFTLTVTDTDASKLEVDANTASFGTAEENATYTLRLKTGGKSSAKNGLTLAIPADGKLRIAARTGSNSATDRTVVLKQGDVELYNKVVLEADKVGDYYPYILVDVKQGTVNVEYPINTINFYAFGFQAVAGPTVGFENIEATEKAVKFIENGQIFILRDGAVYNLMGARVK